MKVLEEIKEKCCSHCEAECDGCWLKELISDHTKQVRKEVCEEIRSKSVIHLNENGDYEYCIEEDILYQIQGDQDGTGNNQ